MITYANENMKFDLQIQGSFKNTTLHWELQYYKPLLLKLFTKLVLPPQEHLF